MKQALMERPLPNYEEDFGHKVEEVVMDVLAKKGLIVEAVEKGTKEEDIRKKVDFWLKIQGLDQPIGIQYTMTGSEEKEEKKIKQLENRKWQVFKATPGTLGWSGKTDLVLIKGNKEKIGHYYNESLKKGVPMAEVIGEEFVRGFFRQLLEQLNDINPEKAKIIVDIFQKKLKEKRSRE